MIEAWVSCWDGTQYALPSPLSWEFSYGLGSPCDGFSMTCVWDGGAEKRLADAVRFYATYEGERVFTGIVDEYRCVRDESGGRLELSGRGMQGLLLDNETLPVEYQIATLKDILRTHVAPYGIETVEGSGWNAVQGFHADGGQSEWSVVHTFVCAYHGITPYFDPMGRLILSGWEDETRLVLDDTAAVLKLTYGERRYGVFSQVVVRNRSKGTMETVRDDTFLEQGGQCRRVMTVTGESSALRETGDYQLRASRAERVCCEVTLCGLFRAFPAQLVQVQRSGFGGNGVYRVAESVCGVNSEGAYTQLTLREVDLIV